MGLSLASEQIVTLNASDVVELVTGGRLRERPRLKTSAGVGNPTVSRDDQFRLNGIQPVDDASYWKY